MKLPGKNASSEAHLEFTAHTEGAVDAWKDNEIIISAQQVVVVEVGARIGASSGALRARMTEREEAARATSKARARFAVRDVVLGLRVNATNDGVLNGPALRNREHPVFKQVFLDGTASDIVRAKPREEPELAGRLHERLGKTDDFPGRAGLLTDLGGAVDKSVVSRQSLLAAEEAESRAKDAERMARITLRLTIEQAYGNLLAAFPGQKSFVETFFPRPDRSAPGETEEEAEGEGEVETKAEAETKTKAEAETKTAPAPAPADASEPPVAANG